MAGAAGSLEVGAGSGMRIAPSAYLVALVLAERWCAGPLASRRLRAVPISARCENACGKLPSWRLRRGSYSSASRPTSLRSASSRSNSACASSVPALQRVVVGEPEAAGEERALARRQAVRAVSRCRSAARSRRAAASRSIAATVPSTRGSSAGRKPTCGISSRLASSAVRAVGLRRSCRARR